MPVCRNWILGSRPVVEKDWFHFLDLTLTEIVIQLSFETKLPVRILECVVKLAIDELELMIEVINDRRIPPATLVLTCFDLNSLGGHSQKADRII